MATAPKKLPKFDNNSKLDSGLWGRVLLAVGVVKAVFTTPRRQTSEVVLSDHHVDVRPLAGSKR